jgi:hypothetical protein
MTVGLLSFASTPSHNGGLAQINMWFSAPAYYDPWALNAFKQMENGWNAVSSGGAVDAGWQALIDGNGYPTAMPSGTGTLTWNSGQLWLPCVNGETWVIDCPGDTATLTLVSTTSGLTLTEDVGARTDTRREYLVGGDYSANAVSNGTMPTNVCLVSARITALTSLTEARLYNKAHESLINGTGATSHFNPEFLNRVKQFGAIRFMDWAQCNTSKIRRWADNNVEADCSWSGRKWRGDWWHGVATKALNTYTISTLDLTHGKPHQFLLVGAPTALTVLAVTNGNPTTIQFTTSHGMATGDYITGDSNHAGGGSWTAKFGDGTYNGGKSTTTGLVPEWQVTVTAADTITVPFDSTGFAAPTAGFTLAPTISITDGVTRKRCVTPALSNSYISGWSGWASPGAVINATYDATFDVFAMDANNSGESFPVGLPPSLMIELCNYCRAHPWFTFPYTCDLSFWTELATLCKATLSPGLIPYFECGNEIWNNGNNFPQTAYASSCSVKSYGAAALTVDLGYSGRTAEVSDTIEAVYGSGSDWQMVMAVQAVSNVSTNRFQGNATINGGSSAGWPLNKCDTIAFGPYIYPAFTFGNTTTYTGFLNAVDDYNTGSTAPAFDWMYDELIASSIPTFNSSANLNQDLTGYLTVQTPRWVNAATGGTYTGRTGAVSVTHYEGGCGVVGGDSLRRTGYPANAPQSGNSITTAHVDAFWNAFLESAQMAQFMTDYLSGSAAAGVTLPSQYVVASPWGTTASWGSYRLNNTEAGPTLQYTALLNWNNGV